MASTTAGIRRVAWVTGASRGIGADTALRLAARGYDVALTARDQGRLDQIAKEVASLGRQALAKASDLTDRASIVAFADEAEAWGQRCDVLCNIGVYQGPEIGPRAGGRDWAGGHLVMEMPIEELALSLEADVVAPVLLCQRAIRSMLANGRGVIVNMSSSVVYLTPWGTIKDDRGWSLSYAAGKAGIDQVGKLINAELGSAGILAYTVEPGYVAYGEGFRNRLAPDEKVPVTPAEAIGAAIAWLVDTPEATRLLSKRIFLPAITDRQQLLPGWRGPGTPYPTRW
jgi:NAD(P)-dependent dehydrogenase (short-subunit alcohol dehydrogenase family)